MKIPAIFIGLLLSGCAATAPTDPQLIKAAFAFAQGTIVETKSPTDLAINGDGMFLLARVAEPKGWEDVVFTRDGVFHFEFKPGTQDGTGAYRLINRDGFFVLGYASAVIENVRPFGTPPEESQGTSLAALDARTVADAPGGSPHPIPLRPVTLELRTNPDVANKLTFDPQGLLHVAGAEPHDGDGKKLNSYVALARPQQKLGLREMQGTFQPGVRYYLYQPAAGTVFTGVAGVGNATGRLIGSANTLTPQAAEQQLPVSTLDEVFAQLHALR